MKLTYEDLTARYEELTAFVRCECVMATELVGGQPADEGGVRQFVTHHLKLTGDEAEKAVHRIMHEEVESVRPPEGEIPEGRIYGLRAVRRTELGPYIGDWMVGRNKMVDWRAAVRTWERNGNHKEKCPHGLTERCWKCASGDF